MSFRQLDKEHADTDSKEFEQRPGLSNQPNSRYVEHAVRVVGILLQGKWRVPILCVLRGGPIRLGQLSRLIPGASKKMLTQNLRKLEADGIIVRTDLSDVVLHIQYTLSEEMRDPISKFLDHLAQWGEKYFESPPDAH